MLKTPTPAVPQSTDLGRRIFGASLLLLLVLMPTAALAHTHGGYSHDSSIGYANDDWMSEQPDDRRLSDLSIPGTHASGAYNAGGDSVLTQTMDLDTQLESGIRAWDVGLHRSTCSSDLEVYREGVSQSLSFVDDVLDVADTFLSENPDEVIFMRIRREEGCATDFDDEVLDAFNTYTGLRYTGSDDNPTLGSARGQVVVLQDFAGADLGVPWSSANVKDHNLLAGESDLFTTWDGVKARFGVVDDGNPNVVYVTFLSGSGQPTYTVYPYFVASGHVSSGTSAARKASGVTTSDPNVLPDFPRVGCSSPPCTVYYEGLNVLATDESLPNVGHAGIVMADFPGAELVESVIDLNVVPGYVYEAESSSEIYHYVGQAVADGWFASVSVDSAGQLAFGPYATYLGEDDRVAVFRAKIGNASPSTVVGYLDVWDATELESLHAPVTLLASDFPAAATYGNFYLPFNLDGRDGNMVETRVWWYDNEEMHLDLIKILEPPFLIRAYDVESDPEISHAVGQQDGDGWSATPGTHSDGTLVYGPYAKYLGPGDKTVTFRARADTSPNPAVGVFYLDVWDATASESLASLGVDSDDFENGSYVDDDFTLTFNLDGREGHQIETRAWWYGHTYARIDFIRIDQK